MEKISKLHEKMKNGKKEIYSMFDRPEIDSNFSKVRINSVFCRGKKSNVSFQFSDHKNYVKYKKAIKEAKYNKNKIRKSICTVFGIDPNDEIFENKFNWAVDGEGDELSKITSMTSSSLCALLCFYNVSKEHPLFIDIDGAKIKFTNSIFEWENPVFKMPSSIDVVLIGRREGKGGKKVIFFVESKFSEYYRIGKCYPSKKYLEDRIGKRIYTDDIFRNDIKMYLDRNKGYKGDNKTFTVGYGKQYAEGVKQMISHYIGVNNFLEGKREYNFGKFLGFIEKADIYLGTIGYKIGKGNDVPYEEYRAVYNRVAKVLNDDLKNNKHDKKFKKVLNMISYQGIFQRKYKKENSQVFANKKIKIYYNL